MVDPETGEVYTQKIIGSSSGIIEMINPAGVIGKIDDVASFAKNLEKAKKAWVGLAKERGIYGFNPSTGT